MAYDLHTMPKTLRLFLFRCTLLAFLFSAVVPFFAVYDLPQAQASQAELASLFGEKILICSDRGFEWVSVADLQQGKHIPKTDSHLKCALCYVASKGGAHHQLSPVVLALDMPLGQSLRLHFSTHDALTVDQPERLTTPRAPPAFV